MTERIQEAAQMAALGLDPLRYLQSRDIMERSMFVEIHNRVQEIQNTRDKNLATEIANQVGRLFKT